MYQDVAELRAFYARPLGQAVRRLLGHRNMKTTVSFYAGLESRLAARHYDGIVARLRQEQPPPTKRRNRRKTAPAQGSRLGEGSRDA